MENKSVSSLEELFLLLPKTAFYINEIYPTLSKVERQMILKATTHEQATALYSNFLMEEDYGRSDSFLAFRYIASDDGILVRLKTWQRKDQSLVVGVIISYSDHCCDYSILKLYHYKNARFKEITEKIFPKLKIEDFVPAIDAETKALFPAKFEHNIYITPEDDFLEISIDHTPTYFGLEKDLVDNTLKLIWKEDRFLVEEE